MLRVQRQPLGLSVALPLESLECLGATGCFRMSSVEGQRQSNQMGFPLRSTADVGAEFGAEEIVPLADSTSFRPSVSRNWGRRFS